MKFKFFGRIPAEAYLEFSRINFQEVWFNQINTEQVSKDSHAMSFDQRLKGMMDKRNTRNAE